jgi:hypothetical protein
MAIVKANYTKSKSIAKAGVGYMEQRPGKDDAKTTRTLFGWDGAMERDQAYRMIDEAGRGTNFFRFIISPDPKGEDTRKDLFMRQITEQTMLRLEERLQMPLQWVAAEHNDHAPHRHVHVIALVAGRITEQDLEELRITATSAALFQRKERDLTAQKKQGRFVKSRTYQSVRPARNLIGFKKSADLQTCPQCGHTQSRAKFSLVNNVVCSSCGFKLYKRHKRTLFRKEANWDR